MSSLRLLPAVCLTVSAALAQLSDACFSPNGSSIPPASVGNTCDPRQPRRATLEAAEPVIAPRPRSASVSVHQLSHEVPKKARQAYIDAAIRHYERAVKLDPRYLEA